MGSNGWRAASALIMTFLAAHPVVAAADGYLWLSGGAELLGDNNSRTAAYGAVFAGADGFLTGLRYTGKSSRPLSDDSSDDCDLLSGDPICASHEGDSSLGEVSLLFGGLFARRHLWAAVGPARAEVTGDRCRQETGRNLCVTTGLAYALGTELPTSGVGFEFTVFGDWNSVRSFGGIAIGLHFGPSASASRTPSARVREADLTRVQ